MQNKQQGGATVLERGFASMRPIVGWPEIQRFNSDHDVTRKAVSAARRCGKSTSLARIILCGQGDAHGQRTHITGALCPSPGVDQPLYVICGPGETWLTNAYWDLVLRMAEEIAPGSVLAHNRREMSIRLVTGAEIRFISYASPRRIIGARVQGAVLDEAQEIGLACDEEEWDRCFLPTLAQPGGQTGWQVLAGCPYGFSASGYFYDRWKSWGQPGREGCASYTFGADVMYTGQQLKLFRESMSDTAFRSQFLAEWLDQGGSRVIYNFTDEFIRPYEYTGSEDLVFGFDFNVRPSLGYATAVSWADAEWAYCPNNACGASISNPYGETVGFEGRAYASGVECPMCYMRLPRREVLHTFHEHYSEQAGNTSQVVEALLKRFQGHQGRVFLTGDASGSQRRTSASGDTDWSIIERELELAFGDVENLVPRSNTHVVERINTAVDVVESGRWHGAFVDPRCRHLIEDIKTVRWLPAMPGKAPKMDTKQGKVGHALDAWTYTLQQWQAGG